MDDDLKRTGCLVLLIGLLFSTVRTVLLMSVVFGLILWPFGLEFQSIWYFLLYIAVAAGIATPLHHIRIKTLRSCYQNGSITEQSAVPLHVLMYTIMTFLAYKITDLLFSSVTATDLGILVASFLLALITIRNVHADLTDDLF